MTLQELTGRQLIELEVVLGEGYGALLSGRAHSYRRTCGLLFLKALDENPDQDGESFLQWCSDSPVVAEYLTKFVLPAEAEATNEGQADEGDVDG